MVTEKLPTYEFKVSITYIRAQESWLIGPCVVTDIICDYNEYSYLHTGTSSVRKNYSVS